MIIESLTLTNVGALGHLELTDLPETGIILLHGPNETGKSTILAALNLLLTTKSKSRKADVLQLVKKGENSFTISLTARFSGTRFQLTRTYLAGAADQLIIYRDHGQNQHIVGATDVERELDKLLANRDQQLAAALAVNQGNLADEKKSLVDLASVKTLTQTLEELAGTQDAAQVATASSSALMEKARSKVDEYWIAKVGDDPQREPKRDGSSYRQQGKKLFQDLEAATQKVAAATANVAATKASREKFSRSMEEKTNLETAIPIQKEKLEEAKKLQTQIAELAQQQQQAKQLLETSSQKQQLLQATQQQRAELAAEQQELAQLLQELSGREETLAQQIAACTQTETQLKAEQAQVGATEQQLREKLAKVQQANKAKEAQIKLAAQQETLAKASALSQELAQKTKRIAEIPATKKDEKRLQKLDKERIAAQIQLQAQGATVAFAGAPGTQVTVGEQELTLDEKGQHEPTVLVKETKITVGDVSLTITPGLGVAEPAELAEKLEQQWHKECTDLGVAGLEELQDVLREKELLSQTEQHLQQQLQEVLAGQSLSDLESAIAQGTAELQAQQELLEQYPDPEAELSSLLAAQEEAAAQAAAVAAKLSALPGKDLHLAATKLEVEKQGAQKRQAHLQKQLASAEAELSSEVLTAQLAQLAEEIANATIAAQGITTQLTEILGEATKQPAQVAQQLVEQEEKRLQKLTGQLQQTNVALAEASATLAATPGTEEELALAQQQQEFLERKLARFQHEADVALYLYRILHEERTLAAEKQLQPLVTQLNSLGRRLYGNPSASFYVNEELQLVSRTIDDVTIEIDRLSTGAREQLGVLVRIVLAGLVSKAEPEPIWLDDTLVFSDPQRQQTMRSIVEQAADYGQVFFVTCNYEPYRTMLTAREIQVGLD